jgi:hypothetical protein
VTAPAAIDPRSPRFGAGITAVLLLVVIFTNLLAETWWVSNGETTWTQLSLQSPPQRLLTPSALLFAAIVALFAWGAFAGIRRHPYGAIFRALIRPRLKPPTELDMERSSAASFDRALRRRPSSRTRLPRPSRRVSALSSREWGWCCTWRGFRTRS